MLDLLASGTLGSGHHDENSTSVQVLHVGYKAAGQPKRLQRCPECGERQWFTYKKDA